MRTVAALSIIGEDEFFLSAWLRHYGRQVGLENCYLISAGANQRLVDLAQGCSLVRLPGDAAASLARKRGRILNNFIAALRCYYTHVIVTRPDEMVLVDPETGGNLRAFLAAVPGKQVLTPLGLDLVHHTAREAATLGETILGPRRHVRVAPAYCNPCIISTDTGLSRNGHLARFSRLNTPAELYLLRLKYCDQSMSCDPQVFEDFAGSARQDGFDMGAHRRAMHASWKKRSDSGYWSFECPEEDTHYLLPERFNGIF